jgi:hypothetical protein
VGRHERGPTLFDLEEGRRLRELKSGHTARQPPPNHMGIVKRWELIYFMGGFRSKSPGISAEDPKMLGVRRQHSQGLYSAFQLC